MNGVQIKIVVRVNEDITGIIAHRVLQDITSPLQ
jgi:hypothetical protein